MANLGKMAKKTFLKKDASKNLKNLYTGYSARKSTVGLATAGLAVGGLAVLGAGSVSNGIDVFAGSTSNGDMSNLLGFRNIGANALPAEQIATAPAFIADAQANKQDKTLGTSGTMVFGMHNLRHG